jgi:lipopolysaccharide/colanic/teichoic acid biosynthesis glycosyltransferase
MNLRMTTLEHTRVPEDMQGRYLSLQNPTTIFSTATERTPSRRSPFRRAEPLTHARKKRIFDLAVAVPMAVVTLPLVLILAIGSAISFRAWPFFTQIRLGQHGKEFRFLKIRSLPMDAPAAANKYALEDIQNTTFGRFLRKFHLDELPQLWLVVWGTMSLVGPRPEMPSLAATFDPDFVVERMTVKPGCTGLWQISDASAGLIGEHPEYDSWYVAHQSLRLDTWVLIRTAREVLGGCSLSSLGDVPNWIPTDETAVVLLDAA